jgi:hypothetical protein
MKENSCAQIRLITRITAAACLCSMLLCYKLWLNERTFPLSPVLGFLSSLQHPFDIILFVLSCICLAGIVLLRKPQLLTRVFLGLSLILALGDQNRWQPWFYQYVLMFVILSFFDFRCDDPKQQKAIVNTFRIMVASVYFWSGLQKLNPHFLQDTFPWLMEPFTNRLGPGSLDHFTFFGYSFPAIEILTGVLLLFRPTMKLAVLSAILMHCFILLILSPFGHNYNPVVWPWNLAMISFVLILFRNKCSLLLSDVRMALQYNSVRFVLILFSLMPLFNFFNLWDSYLSHNLYSGNTSNGVIYLSDAVKNKLPAEIQLYAKGEMDQNQIVIKYWGMMELNVPAYPEKRNFEAVTKSFYIYAGDPSEIYLMYTPKIRLQDQ